MNTQEAHILVVDDDDQWRVMLGFLLRHESYTVEAQPNASQVVEATQKGDVALLILDISITPVDGFTLVATLRDKGCCPPFVVLSGHTERGAVRRAFELGALDYMVKPIDPVEFIARVRIALRRTGGCTQPQSSCSLPQSG